jgi:hypothetical protein
MKPNFDEFSKSLAQSCSRRESLWALGALVAGAVLSRIPLASAWAGGPNGCKDFCNRCPKQRRSQCLSACQACSGDTQRLCGACGNYACCGAGSSCCGDYCADLADDVYNCGECGYVCEPPGPYEYGACIDGQCEYVCAEGAVACNGACTSLASDENNCGECGNVCPGAAPYCNQGACSACPAGTTLCGDQCVDILSDPNHCGACGSVCGGSAPYCSQGECVCPSLPHVALCDGVCVNLLSDNSNCGACGNVCPLGYVCSSGACWDPICQFVEC